MLKPDFQRELVKLLGKRARFDLDLDRLTTWGVGGPVRFHCRVHTPLEAAQVISLAKQAKVPWMVLGRGSNLLVSDQGYPGVMLRLAGPLAKLELEDGTIKAGAGASLPALVKLAAVNGLSGLEWAVGIPATVGGAVAGNAGANGFEMSDITDQISLLLENGEIKAFKGQEIKSGYRHLDLPAQSLVLEALLEFKPDDPAMIHRRMKRLLERRLGAQPLIKRTAGSVFKNPPGDYAGRLIEQAGCKGLSVGDAMVSVRHANFIENRGKATASQIIELMQVVSDRVKSQAGVRLQPEVEVVGRV
ncbi:UDP-N-acetylenolpyruvoylglucosamine reductase [Dethiosulfatarculus sandiegensis]|uniref:UDP-N-acetylenolpyruvoylglucosamine reductase n=1 Tax=Dethiosulfatarculus sandiegensis TaxID=1429043 RepID=A0A0D2JH76_9BACT|nr:UDP-N-acetylenolpyruvoylglucosamine reductase [Dethiosulfatarculus sandiegensis]